MRNEGTRGFASAFAALWLLACGGVDPAAAACEDALTACGDSCVDLRFDVDHCGACGIACPSGVGCFAGSCTSPASVVTPREGHAMVAGSDGRLYVIGGIAGEARPSSSVEAYDVSTNQWNEIAPLPEPRTYMGVAARGGDILVVGGSDISTTDPAGDTHATVWRFDLNLGTWSTAQSLAMPLQDPGVALDAEGRVWAIWGSVDGSTPVTAMASLDDTGKWSEEPVAAPMTPRWAARAVASGDGRIFLVGGMSSWQNPPTAEVAVDVLDPSTHTLTPAASLPTPRGIGGAALGADGRIYYFGGHGGGEDARTNDTWILDPDEGDEGTWTAGAPMPVGLYDTAAATGPDGRIYVIGGHNGTELFQSDTLVYDPVRDEWYF